jgi:hypothetical protein
MERQHEVMSLFNSSSKTIWKRPGGSPTAWKPQRRPRAMNESQKASSRTITDLIGRSRETNNS